MRGDVTRGRPDDARAGRPPVFAVQPLPSATLVRRLGGPAGLLAILRVGHGAGARTLPLPGEPGEWLGWALHADPAVVVLTLGRLGVLALAWYVAAAVLLGAIARCTRSLHLARVAEALTTPRLRRLVDATLGISLAGSLVLGPTSSAWASPGSIPLVGELGGSSQPGTLPLDELREPSLPGPAASPRFTPLALELAGGDAPVADDRAEDLPSDDARVHVVVAGEHLWSIARDALTRELGGSASDEAVVGYWRRTIEENRHRLVDPDNPDLIFPGQRFVLPLPSTSGSHP